MSELKPCPFCGSDDINLYGDSMFECQGCGFIIDDVSIEEWNARHIPEGYKLVPIEPTKQMLLAGNAVLPSSINCDRVYKAMLDAAKE